MIVIIIMSMIIIWIIVSACLCDTKLNSMDYFSFDDDDNTIEQVIEKSDFFIL